MGSRDKLGDAKMTNGVTLLYWGLLGGFCLIGSGAGCRGDRIDSESRGWSIIFGCDKKVLSTCSITRICVLVFRDSLPVGNGTTTRKE